MNVAAADSIDLVIFDCDAVLVDHARSTSVVGVRDVLEGLRSQGIAAAVAAQSPRASVELALSATGLASHFDGRVFTASVVPRSKPAPDLLLYAAARTRTDPTRCAVVDGSPSGVRAAVESGMRLFGYAADEDVAALEAAGATTTFRSMGELSNHLAVATRRAREEGVAPSATRGNAALVREAYQAFAAGNGRALVELLSDGVVYHLPGNHLGGGTVRGRAELFGRLAAAAAALDAQPTMRIGAVVGSGEWVLSIERFIARRAGRVLDQDVCVVWRMIDGRCTEMWARFADQASCDRFWR